jgi:hypothetical protein
MSLVKNKDPFIPKKDPSVRPDYSPYIVTALRAVANGEATEKQQKDSMDYIINTVCGTYDLAYRPGVSDRSTIFALGKAHAGQTLVFLLNSAVTTKAALDKASARKAGDPDVSE